MYFKLERGGQKRGLQKVAEIVRTTIFVEKSCWYARFWLEENSSSIVRTTIFIEPDSCVPLFFSSRIRAYPHFFELFDWKNKEIDDFPTISGTWVSKIVPGFFIMVSWCFLIVIFHFSGPAVVPPTKGAEEGIFSRNLRLGSKRGLNRSFFRGICDWVQIAA